MPALDIQAILKALPHRYPFLLVDRILEYEKEKRIIGIKNVTFNEPFFMGHFPGRPIMPGVLIIEAMAQLGGVLLLQDHDLKEKGLVYLVGIDNAKFRKTVIPGDQLRIVVDVLRYKYTICKMRGEAYVNETLVAEAEFLTSLQQESSQ
ncbi:MAG: 3-hydroxyacyl-[acyl-carrier-protein] dehydratase FabZ [Acidobacteria bacterium]|nr:MAG: 3-hydroxyacyl-[acyl-carrier-protein] dehydratase FabZ [Acidobacteriota bacterium]